MLRRVALIGTTLLVAVPATAWAVIADWNSRIDTAEITDQLGTARPTSRAAAVSTPDPADPFDGRPLNVAVFGSDSRDGDNGKLTDHASAGIRSDVTMIVHVSAARDRIDIVSIPRDTTVTIPTCTLSDGTENGLPWTTKFNAAFSRGGEHGNIGDAAACSIKTLEEVTDVRIDQFVVVDFSGFVSMIDALGGVDMKITHDMSSTKAKLDITKGTQILDGKTALAFARARTGQGLGDGSDLSRLDRQHQLVSAVAKSVTKRNLLTSTPALYSFVNAVTDSLTTSPELGSVQTIAGLAFSLRHTKPSAGTAVTAPNDGDPNDPAKVFRTAEAQEVFDALAEDRPLPANVTGADDADPSASASPAPSSSRASSHPSSSRPSAYRLTDADSAGESVLADGGPVGRRVP
ncbi:MAG: LCP family protein [Bifidobacteriaceae bacterium]|nr:LCP family protein [Bifidobacteriaceae bacterium]